MTNVQRGCMSVCLGLLAACSGVPEHPPLPRPDAVDLQRFMGDWHVIGSIPLFPERNAYGGIESYELKDGKILTTFRFRDGGFDQPVKTYRPVATVVPGTDNTQWKMQFIWPFKADYRIAYLSPDYQVTIIARKARDYVWLMARQPQMGDEVYAAMLARIAAMGYDMEDFRRQPQR